MSAQFDHVLFDAGGTLIGTNTDSEHWYEQFFVDACAEQGCHATIAQVHEVLRRAARSRQFDRRCSTDAQTRAFWHHIYATAFADLLGAKGCGHTPAVIDHLAADYIDRFEEGEFIRLFPDTLDTLSALKAAGVHMGIVSNFGTYLNAFLKKLGIDEYFDFVLVSAAEGCEKPHPDIFDRALSRCNGSRPERILFVGDHPEEDYAAAERHSMTPVLIDRHNRHADKPLLTRIRKLTQLPQVVSEGVTAALA
jgi:HAD superfamily hydrolase (TIGR01549 family)